MIFLQISYRVILIGCGLLMLMLGISAEAATPSSCAVNMSQPTLCAEHDEVSVGVYLRRKAPGKEATITALHPRYSVTNWSCLPDFTNCPAGEGVGGTPVCSTVFDNGVTVIRACEEPGFWKPAMSMSVRGGQSATGHRIVIHQRLKLPREATFWPEVFAMYSDGYARLKPLINVDPDVNNDGSQDRDNCYGASVVIGPAQEVATRPFAEVSSILIDKPKAKPVCLFITYTNGTTARLCLTASRTQAVASLTANYDFNATDRPLLIYRSNFVDADTNDVTHVRMRNSEYTIDEPFKLAGTSWLFHRLTPSSIRQSAPDIRIQTHR